MARRARISWPGGVFHVISRFARDEWWLEREGARQRYLDLLGHAAETSRAKVLAYCLMSNHVHLVVVQGDRPLERFMKSLHTAFAAWIRQRVKGRAARGPVFADRPRTVLIERERYLADLIRYVHNNPVRAGVVRYARNSEWTSHQACTGKVPAPQWLSVDYVTELFGTGRQRAAKRFDRFVDEGRKQQRRPELSGVAHPGETSEVRRVLGDRYRLSDGVLGSEAFVARVRAQLARSQAGAASRSSPSPSDAIRRATVLDVLEAALACLDVAWHELEQSPRSRRAASVKRLTIWVWIRVCRGRAIDAARALPLDTSIVSRYYGQAVAAADEMESQAIAVTKRLRRKKAGNLSTRSPALAPSRR